jgi:hypothetical protein
MPKKLTVESLIKQLSKLDPKTRVYIACDEELNTIYSQIACNFDEDNNMILFGLSGSEINEEF